MNREELEKLLPAYAAGELSPDESTRVEASLEEFPEARESLEEFRALESVLLTRREQVPAPDQYVRAVFAASRLDKARKVMDTLFSFPALTGAALVLFGVVLFVYRTQITTWFNRKASLPDTESLGLDWVGAAIVQFAGGDVMMLTAIYVAVTLLILLSTSLMLMRFLRG
jgi:anti-sigma factor RsiW